MEWLNNLLGRGKTEAPHAEPVGQVVDDVVAPRITPEVIDPPGKRVYHEIFLTPADVNGHHAWSARVYGPDGYVTNGSGMHLFEHQALSAAIAWCERAMEIHRAKIGSAS